MDPLAELVKIDPKSIGVGQYQHDVDQTKLKKALDQTVENCVNLVGVNLNTASSHLLTYISGLGPQLAQNIVNYRAENGAFGSRKELTTVGPHPYPDMVARLQSVISEEIRKQLLEHEGRECPDLASHMKVERHSKIVELIGKYEIETQEELAERLNEAGFNVTQATVSRDIRELKLTKMQSESGRQRYMVLESPRGTSAIKYIRILKDGYMSMWASH